MENTEKITVIKENSISQILYPMKWFKFMIYFLLWVTAIWNILVGYECILKVVKIGYQFWNLSRSIDFIYGIAMISVGISLIITRFKLAKYKSIGLQMYYFTHGIYIGVYFVYNLFVYYMAGIGEINGELMDACIVTIVHVVVWRLNDAYFHKRKLWFCN